MFMLILWLLALMYAPNAPPIPAGPVVSGKTTYPPMPTPRAIGARMERCSAGLKTVKRPVSAQRVSTRPTHADAPVPQQITAIGDDGTHHTCTHGLKALRRMGFLPWPVERKPARTHE